MAKHTFNEEKKCPKCGTGVSEAELDGQYDPVVVVHCPSCNELLWLPGSDETTALFPYDPDADAGGF